MTIRKAAGYLVMVTAVAGTYFVLAKIGLALASLHPSASPIWPPSGFALAAVMLWGYRAWPAIYVGAFLANATTAGSIYTALAISVGNTGEAVLGLYLLNRLANGPQALETPAGIARFAAISLFPAMLSASVGVASLSLAGYASWQDFGSIWLTWWLGDVAGALVIAPVIVMWATKPLRFSDASDFFDFVGVFAAVLVVGVIAFSPLIAPTVNRAPLGFLAVLPLLWAALRRGQRDTVTAALLLSCFAIWGTRSGVGPFARDTLNESFLLLLMFIISVTVPSLALSADVAARKRTEASLRAIQEELNERVRLRMRDLAEANSALKKEVEQRKDAVSQLKQQSVHLLEAQRLADLGSWIWDIPQGKVRWSDQLYQIYGLRSDEFAGTVEDFISRIHEEDRPRIKAQIEGALKFGHSFRMDERIVRPDGEIRYLRSCGEVVRNEQGIAVQMLGICQDVTDQKKAESALRASEKQYELLIKSVQDYAIYMVDPDGIVVSWNAGAARIKQYSADEVIGQHFNQFFTAEDRELGLAERSLEIAARAGKHEAEGWRVRKDGSRFWASAMIEAIRDDSGQIIGFAKITRDITERRDAQIALEQTREQLAQAQKLEAIGQLTGGIAHDFNNLLMIVSGHAQILRRRISDAKAVQAVDAIHAAANRGESLTRQLLAFSRRQQLSPVVVDLAQHLDAMRDMLRSSLRGNIEFVVDLPSGIWLVEVDVAEFELALVNVAVNARDAMPNGGKFTLSVRNLRLAPNQDGGKLDGDFVAVVMSDTGTGVPPEIKTKIFDPFFTTKPVGKGTGLGLSQVYGFAQQSGGAVHVDSEVGRGTTVTLYLPRKYAALPSQAEAPGVQAERHNEGTILLVEDDAEVAKTTALLLEQLGYQVIWEENAANALKRLDMTESVALILSDIVMPGGMDGVALAREIRSRFPHIPVLLTSGYSDAVRAAEHQFAILRKPFQISALDKAVRETLEQHGPVAA